MSFTDGGLAHTGLCVCGKQACKKTLSATVPCVTAYVRFLCQRIPGVQLSLLVSHPARGDDLHHHLQRQTHYVRQRFAAEGLLLRRRGPLSFALTSPALLCDVALAPVKDRARGKVGRSHTLTCNLSPPRANTPRAKSVLFPLPPTFLSHPGKVSAFTL